MAKTDTNAKNIEVRDVNGGRVRPLDGKDAQAIVLFFIAHDCPAANGYVPEINALCKEYGARHVSFYMVYTETDTPAATLKKHAMDYKFRCPAVIDSRHKLVKAMQATVTPEAFLLSPRGKILYQGRIDDRYVSLGKIRHQPTTHDLRQALDATLEGREISHPKTKCFGCFISNTK